MQPKNSAQALKQLQGYQAKMQNPQDILQSRQAALGIPQAQQNVSGLRQAITNTTNLLNQVPDSVRGRTGGSLVTAAQAGRQIQNEQAPVAQQLQSRGQEYGEAQEGYGMLSGQAEREANAQITGDQQRLGNLQSIYEALFGREQAKEAAKLEREKLAEARRAAKAASAGYGFGGGLGGGGGAGGGGGGAGFKMQRRKDGGYNFVNAQGAPVSAASFAAAKGIPFRQLLSDMSKGGDKGAKSALGFVGNDFGYDPGKVNTGLYNALTWGYRPNASTGGGGGSKKVNKNATRGAAITALQPFNPYFQAANLYSQRGSIGRGLSGAWNTARSFF